MGNVLISLEKKDEIELRKISKDLFGDKKGALSKTVSLAITDLKRKAEKKKAYKELIALMEKGVDLGLQGKKVYEKRSELYDR